jgi:Holliday junction resolvasome RuvABC DNA-binding subunit
MRRPRNDEIAASLEKVADLLEAQHASIYRVRAYRAAARTLRGLEAPIADLVGGEEADGLESLPGIGKSIAAAIREIVTTGRLRQLERLEGQASPQELFSTIPGIGGELARRIESQLHIESLEDLEAAAHDGRLETVPGFGLRRVRIVRESLESRLRFSAARRPMSHAENSRSEERPRVSVLLEMDRIYRELSTQDKLRKIAPRRFNPEHRTWLPVLHRELAGWSLTAMYSNTARAHQLGRTHEWVVIYYERDGIDGQCTVVPEYSGALEGKCVVRGREAECAQHYALASSSDSVGTAVVGESC